MIRSNNKVFGEPNDEDTVLAPSTLLANKPIVSDGAKQVRSFNPGAKNLIYIDSNGNVTSKTYNLPNRYVGTDENGNLTVYEGILIPEVAPSGRTLVFEDYGNINASDALKSASLTLSGPYWFEIEVTGAGGGGGGCGWRSGAHVDGSNGAEGGYYKTLFIVNQDADSNIQYGIGTPGQGGAGPYYEDYKGDKQIRGTNSGGRGGKSPIVYGGWYGTGGNAPFPYNLTNTRTESGGPGIGINGGADGGGYTIDHFDPLLPSYIKPAPTAGGGGASGPYGGDGASVTYWSESVLGDNNVEIGGSGGAGAGCGYGGNGASTKYSSTSEGGVGQSGGGGGAGTYYEDSNGYNSTGEASGAGGGGGGASRVTLTNVRLSKTGERQTLEIVCGGGGGGAGASNRENTTGWQVNDGLVAAIAGGNNQDSNLGGGGVGGIKSSTYGNTTLQEVRGGTGGRAHVKIWRCI